MTRQAGADAGEVGPQRGDGVVAVRERELGQVTGREPAGGVAAGFSYRTKPHVAHATCSAWWVSGIAQKEQVRQRSIVMARGLRGGPTSDRRSAGTARHRCR